MLGIERRREIMKLLNQHQKVYVQDLSKLFDVTDEQGDAPEIIQ